MTEKNRVHAVARRFLHAPPAMLYKRVDNPLEKGFPDAAYCVLGASGYVEEKEIAANGKAPDHFTLEQAMWGLEWARAGGLWHLLGKRGGEWVLYDALGAARWHDGIDNKPIVVARGAFPVAKILGVIAPPERRSRT